MYAVFQDGDKQYRAEPGLTLTLEKKSLSPGSELEFDRVLLLRTDDTLLVGTPTIEGAKVLAEVQDQFRGKKLVAYKYKRRVGYHRKKGHRQSYTRVTIKDIVAP